MIKVIRGKFESDNGGRIDTQITCDQALYKFYPYDGECKKYGITVAKLNDE